MFKFTVFSLPVISVIVSGMNQYTNIQRGDLALPPPVHNLLGRQECDAEKVPCGTGCIWDDQICCDNGAYVCNTGAFCYAGGIPSCCYPGWVVCGVSCIADGNQCCDEEAHWCGPLEFCCIKNTGELACCIQGATFGTTIVASTTYPTGATLLGPSATTGSLSVGTSAVSTSPAITSTSGGSTTNNPSTAAGASTATTTSTDTQFTSATSSTDAPAASTTASISEPSSTVAGSPTDTTFSGGAMATAVFPGSDLLAALFVAAGQMIL